MERLMKNGITTHGVLDEYYVIQMDGRVKSEHPRFWMRSGQPCNSEINSRITTSNCAQCK